MQVPRAMDEQLRQLLTDFPAFREEKKAGQEFVKGELKTVQEKVEGAVNSHKEEMKANQEEVKASQGKMEGAIKTFKEEK
ncbi:hypothetical protein X975_03064, partial [Stegodyphus mimosarum]